MSTRTCVINVEGMTCGSCVQSIEETVGERSGVSSIKVSLEEGKATIEYDTSAETLETLREAIDDMGFDASLPTAAAASAAVPGSSSTAPLKPPHSTMLRGKSARTDSPLGADAAAGSRPFGTAPIESQHRQQPQQPHSGLRGQ